ADRPRVIRQPVAGIPVLRRADVQPCPLRRTALQLELQGIVIAGVGFRRKPVRRDARWRCRVSVAACRLSFSAPARRGVLSFRRMAFIAPILTLITLAGPSPTRFATSRDGTRIAYDITGTGPALILLHGGGGNRRDWHGAGYVSRLSSEFTVITIDQRGSGESEKPLAASAYAVDELVDDVLAVADAAGAQRFALWGFSSGANIGRYVVVR